MKRTIVAAVLAVLGARAWAAEHGPVALYQPALVAPPGAPFGVIVRAKLTIDPAGKVSRVDVSAVEPSTAFDDGYKAAAVAGFSKWRFAPAEKEGTAIASESLVAIPFEANAGGPRTDAFDARYLWHTSTESGFESARYDERVRILAMSPADRRKLADDIAAKAEALIKKGTRATAANDWFEVVTDFGGQKQADGLLNNVGATYSALIKLFGQRIPPLPRQERIRVFVFETAAQYRSLCEQTIPFEGSDGFYSPAGVLAFHTQHATLGMFNAILLHETTHAFMDRHLIRQGVELPRWLGEGFAEYIGDSDVKDGQIIAGGHKKKQELGAAYGFWQSPSKARATDAKGAQKESRALTLEQIISAGIETFYGKDVDLYYAQGWLAVHFLRHGRPGWSDGAFSSFMLYVAEGYPARDALRTAYGVEPGSLEAEYQAYVKKF